MNSAKDIGTAIFICNASKGIGTGHIRRCELLAKQLISCNVAVKFLFEEMPEFWIDRLEQNGFSVAAQSFQDSSGVLIILKK